MVCGIIFLIMIRIFCIAFVFLTFGPYILQPTYLAQLSIKNLHSTWLKGFAWIIIYGKRKLPLPHI